MRCRCCSCVSLSCGSTGRQKSGNESISSAAGRGRPHGSPLMQRAPQYQTPSIVGVAAAMGLRASASASRQAATSAARRSMAQEFEEGVLCALTLRTTYSPYPGHLSRPHALYVFIMCATEAGRTSSARGKNATC